MYLTEEIVCFAGVIPILHGGSDVVTFRSIDSLLAHKGKRKGHHISKVLKKMLHVECSAHPIKIHMLGLLALGFGIGKITEAEVSFKLRSSFVDVAISQVMLSFHPKLCSIVLYLS